MNYKHILFHLRLIFILLLSLYSFGFSQELNEALSLYKQGDFKSAQEMLESYLESNPSDFEALYYSGKLEKDADKSSEYFKRVWESSSLEKREESAIELCLYYQAMGLDDSLLGVCSGFKKAFPQSPFLPQILWMENQALFSEGEFEQALKGFKNIVEKYPFSFWAGWAQLGMGKVYFFQQKFNQSIKEYKKVLENYAETEVLPLALAGLYSAFESAGEKDKGILYLNLYKEKYPEGIDLQSQVRMEEVVKEKYSTQAERITGTRYAVQIGVFASKENADKVAKKLSARGYKPEQSYKEIKNKRYYVIQVGSFYSLEEAQRLRDKLEQEEGEAYAIVMK